MEKIKTYLPLSLLAFHGVRVLLHGANFADSIIFLGILGFFIAQEYKFERKEIKELADKLDKIPTLEKDVMEVKSYISGLKLGQTVKFSGR